MNWKYKLLLSLNIIYCVLGASSSALPAWRMFEHVEMIEYQLTDRHGRQIAIKDFLPGNAYLIDFKMILPIVSFICAKRPLDGPFHFKSQSHNVDFILNSDQCEIPNEISRRNY